jgi:hypothetical protein
LPVSLALTKTQAYNQCWQDTHSSAGYILSLYGYEVDYSDTYPSRAGEPLPPGVSANQVNSNYVVVWVGYVALRARFGITYYCHVKVNSNGPYSYSLGTWWGPGWF